MLKNSSITKEEKAKLHKRIDGYLKRLKEINDVASKRILELSKISIWVAEHTPPPVSPSEELMTEAKEKNDRVQAILKELSSLQEQMTELNKAYDEEASRLGLTKTNYIEYIK